jgi:hypothetical protein
MSEKTDTTRRALRKALTAMIRVEEVGFGLPLPDRSYAVRINTKGSNVTLAEYGQSRDGMGKKYPTDATTAANAKSAAESSRKYFINEIADRIHTLLETP